MLRVGCGLLGRGLLGAEAIEFGLEGGGAGFGGLARGAFCGDGALGSLAFLLSRYAFFYGASLSGVAGALGGLAHSPLTRRLLALFQQAAQVLRVVGS